jgi:ABC-type sulfate/molybdate transport systems ATPase subunit
VLDSDSRQLETPIAMLLRTSDRRRSINIEVQACLGELLGFWGQFQSGKSMEVVAAIGRPRHGVVTFRDEDNCVGRVSNAQNSDGGSPWDLSCPP